MNGWHIWEGKHGDRLAFRCSCCFLHTVFAQGETPEVFHCNRLERYQKPKPTFWDFVLGVDELPRFQPSVPVVLMRRQPDEDEFLQP